MYWYSTRCLHAYSKTNQKEMSNGLFRNSLTKHTCVRSKLKFKERKQKCCICATLHGMNFLWQIICFVNSCYKFCYLLS